LYDRWLSYGIWTPGLCVSFGAFVDQLVDAGKTVNFIWAVLFGAARSSSSSRRRDNM